MPSQMVTHTVEACTVRFQHPSNKPSDPDGTLCLLLVPRGGLQWYQCVMRPRGRGVCMCVFECVSVSVFQTHLKGICGFEEQLAKAMRIYEL